MELRALGSTGIMISPLGLGTVKFGRNQQVKYPRPFDLPSDREVVDLLELARELGINMLDTAPAYGISEQRLGRLLPGSRDQWVIVSKVGESFVDGHSRFDFSSVATCQSVERSLRTLNTDYLDVLLIHSDGDDLRIIEQTGVVEALVDLKRRGLIRAYGMSSKTVAGGLRVVADMDVVMATANLAYDAELPVLQAAAQADKGVLIKKGLMSGHLSAHAGVRESMQFVFSQPGVSGMIVGTIDPAHLRSNAAIVSELLA